MTTPVKAAKALMIEEGQPYRFDRDETTAADVDSILHKKVYGDAVVDADFKSRLAAADDNVQRIKDEMEALTTTAHTADKTDGDIVDSIKKDRVFTIITTVHDSVTKKTEKYGVKIDGTKDANGDLGRLGASIMNHISQPDVRLKKALAGRKAAQATANKQHASLVSQLHTAEQKRDDYLKEGSGSLRPGRNRT